MLLPDYKEFARLAREATLVPVVKSVTADLLTPVSAYLAVAKDEPHCFLLESIERGEQIGRYTFLGARPYMRVSARAREVRGGVGVGRCAKVGHRTSELPAGPHGVLHHVVSATGHLLAG